jgi:hypothetical protein
VEDELVKVIRIGGENPPLQPTNQHGGRTGAPLLSEDFSYQVLSGVRFAALLSQPDIPTVLHSRVWCPSAHSCYPDSFRKACTELLLCARAPPVSPVQAPAENVACKLPRALWMEIFSYTRRDWFEPPVTQEALKRRLQQEQAATQRARDAQAEAETRLQLVERERDLFRLLALRWKRRLQVLMNERGETAEAASLGDDILSGLDDVVAVADGPVMIGMGGLGALIRRLRRTGSSDEEDEDDDDEDVEEDEEGVESMEDDSQVSEEADSMQQEVLDIVEPMSVSPPELSSSAMVIRTQIRSVSITSSDL